MVVTVDMSGGMCDASLEAAERKETVAPGLFT